MGGTLPLVGSALDEATRNLLTDPATGEVRQAQAPSPGTPIWCRSDPYWQPSRAVAPLLTPIGVWAEVDDPQEAWRKWAEGCAGSREDDA